MKRRLAVTLMCALLMFTAALSVSADAGSVTVLFAYEKQPLSGVTFALTPVGSWDNDHFTLNEPFASDGIVVPDEGDDEGYKALAQTLASYAARDNVPPLATLDTDANGQVRFDNIAEGLYLVTGDSAVLGELTVIPLPTLVSIPYVTPSGDVSTDAVCEPKVEVRTPVPETVERRALKIWEDDGNEADRPESVTVQLLRDGEIYEEVTLNSENNWRVSWENLDAAYTWQVTEKDVPEGYTVQIEQQGITFTMTNTKESPPPTTVPSEPSTTTPTEPPTTVPGEPPTTVPPTVPPTQPTDPPKPTLPQTGMLWWPVPVLILSGAAALFIGVYLLRRKKG